MLTQKITPQWIKSGVFEKYNPLK